MSALKNTARKIFGDLYSSYDFVLEYFTLFQDRYWKRRLLEGVALSPSRLILDVGCGTGVLEKSLEESAVTVVGVDITKEMLKIAQGKKISCFASVVQGDAEALPFRSECFDCVLSCYVVKYCNCSNFVEQMHRVLKPGGRLALYDFAKPQGAFAPFYFFYVYGVMRLLGIFTRRFHRGMSITFTELPKIISQTRWCEELPPALAKHGFQNISSSPMSGGSAVIFFATKPE